VREALNHPMEAMKIYLRNIVAPILAVCDPFARGLSVTRDDSALCPATAAFTARFGVPRLPDAGPFQSDALSDKIT
jgi:hypothetical protein